jgi:hypothetical protein
LRAIGDGCASVTTKDARPIRLFPWTGRHAGRRVAEAGRSASPPLWGQSASATFSSPQTLRGNRGKSALADQREAVGRSHDRQRSAECEAAIADRRVTHWVRHAHERTSCIRRKHTRPSPCNRPGESLSALQPRRHHRRKRCAPLWGVPLALELLPSPSETSRGLASRRRSSTRPMRSQLPSTCAAAPGSGSRGNACRREARPRRSGNVRRLSVWR